MLERGRTGTARLPTRVAGAIGVAVRACKEICQLHELHDGGAEASRYDRR